MAGYNGYSMSNNAVTAYKEGEKPLSKFNKDDYNFYCEVIKEALNIEVKQMTIKEFKELVEKTCESGWHHTSKMYNKTYFYDIIYGLTNGTYNTKDYYTSLKDEVLESILEEYEADGFSWIFFKKSFSEVA